MDGKRYKQVKSLFADLVLLDPDDRDKVIIEKCGSDDELKAELHTLLKSYDDSKDFFEIQSNFDESQTDPQTDPMIGNHIGPYLIEREAGEGGMGIVYAGKRDDKQFEQKVAIKILRQGFTSHYLLKRFEIERQTLANLQHSNIARLLDGGKTDNGLPYLVMEYIDGTPLTEYCDENKLTIKERLELFRTVCSAVQYAHQNLIVHRDIKPGNILVTKDGNPKLLDFGIAKLLDEDLTELDKRLMRTGVWHLTPEFASPEQIKGESITTSSDIYSLGVMLYQLLTGHQPYQLTSSSPVAIGRIITEEQVVKPSEKIKETEEIATTDGTTKKITPESISNYRMEKPEKLYNHLRGDLDNIIIKAMHKDPSRRYASVEQFSEDIRRHLIGLPVIARNDTLGYRLSKFIQRHRVGFVSSIIFVSFLIASVIIIAWQTNIASKERDNARIEAKKFERVNTFLQGMLSSVDPNELGRDVKVYDILEKAADDIETDLKDQPEIEADISRTLGNTYVNLGEYEVVKPHLYNSLDLNEKLYGNESSQVATSLHDIALLYHWTGDYQLTDSLYNKALIIYRKVLNEPTEELAVNLNDYATLLNEFGDHDKAERYLREALEIIEKLKSGKNGNAAGIMNNLAITLHYKNNLIEAEKYYLKAQTLFIELFGKIHPNVGSTYNNLAFIYMDNDDYPKAEEYFTKSYEIKISLKGEDHPDVGLGLNNLGRVQYEQQNYKTAETYFRKALKQYTKTLSIDHIWVGRSNYWLGKTLMGLNEFSKAEEQFRASLIIRKKALPQGHHLIFVTKGELGICLLKQNNVIDAENFLLSSYEGSKTATGMEHSDINRILQYLIVLYEKKGENDKVFSYNEIFRNQSKN